MRADVCEEEECAPANRRVANPPQVENLPYKTSPGSTGAGGGLRAGWGSAYFPTEGASMTAGGAAGAAIFL
jgi:hypothetical protein